MKLVHQINLAFGIALVLVLVVAGFVLHYVLLDHLIGAQKEDLKAMSVEMTTSLKMEILPLESRAAKQGTMAMPVTPSKARHQRHFDRQDGQHHRNVPIPP